MPGGAAHLVRRERDEVGVPRLHVDGEVGRRLAGVDEHVCADRVGGIDQRAHVVDRAEDVRHRTERDQLGAVEQCVEPAEVEQVVGSERDPPDLDAALGGEDLPRHHVGVVFHVGQHDRVALAQIRAGPRVRDDD